MGSGADIKIGEDDSAAIEPITNTTGATIGFKMISDYYSDKYTNENGTEESPQFNFYAEGIGIDTKKFDKGVDDVSRICGQFSALKSVGMSDKDAMEVITNLITIQINNDTIEGNVRVANLQDTLTRV